MLRSLGAAVAGLLLLAGAASAQESAGAFDQLSPGNQAIVDALHFFQQPPENTEPLTRDQIAELKAEDGWGDIFRQLKDEGFFPEHKNLGQVVSGFNHHRIGLHENGRGAAWKRPAARQATVELNRPNRPVRVQRFHRPSRPQRPDRPNRPHRR